ncbi:MAG: hypothetical protein DDT19_01990 [Syntrophomonadaceae bacterium]|nr:hypothetical protein [Bacillota bacterium]
MLLFVKLALLTIASLHLGGCAEIKGGSERAVTRQKEIQLPSPMYNGPESLEAVLARRSSGRSFSDKPLPLHKLAQILWASQGTAVHAITGATRTAPSAGATYPLEVYVVAGNVDDLAAGIYHYNREEHSLLLVSAGEYRDKLANIALRQDFIGMAAVSIVIVADYARTTRRYGTRGLRYVHMEIGHVTQNIHLQAEAMRLVSVAVGAFEDDRLKIMLKTEYEPLMIVPVGYQK